MPENNLTQKEILFRLMDKVENLPALVQSVENIDNHLSKLNSKVASHVKEIQALKDEHRNIKSFAAAISVMFGVIITGVNLLLK
jgi:hypothetical protein